MSRLTVISLCLLFSAHFLSAKTSTYKLADSTAPVIKIISYKGAQYALTPHQLLLLNNKTTSPAYTSNDVINDMTVAGNKLYLATSNGLLAWDGSSTKQYMTGEPVKCLATDSAGRLWVGNTYKGAYVMQDDSFSLKVEIPSILSMATTSDGYIWVGTNVGLYRLSGKDFSSTRYAEEGYSGYELPDNIVEALYGDALSNVWVIMPDNLSFKKGSSFSGELPTFDFLGSKGNAIYNIVALKDQYYLFLTEQGPSLLPIAVLHDEHQHATEEVHEAHGKQAYTVANDRLDAPEMFVKEKIRYACALDGQVWFATSKGIWASKESRLLKSLHAKQKQPRSAAVTLK